MKRISNLNSKNILRYNSKCIHDEVLQHQEMLIEDWYKNDRPTRFISGDHRHKQTDEYQ